MEKATAHALLRSTSNEDRLRGARLLFQLATEDDLPFLQAALARENNRWVRAAIQRAVSALLPRTDPQDIVISVEDEDERILEQVRADAVEETTKRLVHELRPILGRLSDSAQTEIPDFRHSETRRHADRLSQFLELLSQLSRAAAPPTISEFDLATLLADQATAESRSGIRIDPIGQKPLIVMGASSYVALISANAIRNAIEATEAIASQDPVVVTWGTTDRDYWLTVLDSGIGIRTVTDRLFDIGNTTKSDHLGMGLALARQAAISINGRIRLTPRKEKGTQFELRWPKTNTK